MDKSNNILFISNRGLLPIKDGHTRRSFNILKGLASTNRVYYLSLYENEVEIDVENVQQFKNICDEVEFIPAPSKKVCPDMLARLICSFFSLEAYTIWRHYSKSLLKRVHELLATETFDLVHCDILPVCYTVKNRNNIFCSVTDHDVSYLKCFRMAQGSRNLFLKCFLYLESLKLKRLEKRIFKQVDLGIVVSELDKSVLQNLCPEGRFLVVENGIDLEVFKPSDEPPIKNKLIWLGGFKNHSNRQGIYYFLGEIYPLVKKIQPDVSIDIVGGDVTKELRTFANTDSSINLTGYVDDPLPYVSRAAVFVAPVLSGGGTKLKVLEAMACGKAIVTTSIGCEGINGIHGQHFLVANETRVFADGIVELLNNELLRKSLQNKARKFVSKKYSYKEICKKLDSSYKGLVPKLKNV